jgi:maleylacetate reductase
MRRQACIGARFAFCKADRRVGSIARRELALLAEKSFLSIFAKLPAGIYRPMGLESVSYLRPWEEVLIEEITRLGAESVFVVAGTTFARKSAIEAQLVATLGRRLAGFKTGVRDHAPREDVVSIANHARKAQADLILAVGGGSVIDAAKIVLLCFAADIRDSSQLGLFAARRHPALPTHWPVRMGAIPTTLSGAEFTDFGGSTDTEHKLKEAYGHPDMLPRFVLLDPRVTVYTPQQLWLSTGVRAIDHTIETLCSPGTNPMADAAAMHALKLMIPNLARTHEEPRDLEARRQSMIGAWLATVGLQSGVPMGASHGIGHALGGTAGVPHGVTSCLMLPHVLRWNKAMNEVQQRLISGIFGDASADAADQVADLVARLGLPCRLRDVGVRPEQFAQIAEVAFQDPWTQANQRPIESPGTIVQLLESAW